MQLQNQDNSVHQITHEFDQKMNLQSEVKFKNQPSVTILDDKYAQQIRIFNLAQYTIDDFPVLYTNIMQQDIVLKHRGVIGLRKLISVEYQPPIQNLIDAGLIPIFISLAQQNFYPQLKFQSTWVLTNIASGNSDQCRSVVNHGGIIVFIDLLKNPFLSIVQQSVWVLGNIAGDCAQFRDMIIHSQGVKQLISVLKSNINNQSLIKNGVWTLSNICRAQPKPIIAQIKQVIQFLIPILVYSQNIDQQLAIDCCWAIRKHINECKTFLQHQTKLALINKLKITIQSSMFSLKTPSISILSQLIQNNQDLVNYFISIGGAYQIMPLLNHTKKAIKKEGCILLCMLSEFKFIQIFQNPDIIKTLLVLFNENNQLKMHILDIFTTISNQLQTYPQKIVQFFIQNSIISYMIPELSSSNKEIVIDVLQCIQNLCQIGRKLSQTGYNFILNQLDQFHAIQKLQNLQNHPSQQVYDLVVKILQQYYVIGEIEEHAKQSLQAKNFGSSNPAGAAP